MAGRVRAKRGWLYGRGPVFAAVLLAVFLFDSTIARAEKRLALLISNQAYAEAVGPLRNPRNDIALIKAALLRVRFADEDIQVVADADRIAMLRAFDDFAARLHRAGPGAISFFYYSGHGAANDRHENFLIPVDIPEVTTDFWYRSVPLRELLDRLNEEAPEAKHFVVFDACRNTLKLRDKRSRALIQPRGFEPVRNTPGMLIAFSTAEGELASDGDRAGPYAPALAEEIVKPGVEAVTVFRNTQLRVSALIGQEPWTQNGPIGETYFAGREPPPHATQTLEIRIPLTTCEKPFVWVSLNGPAGKCIKPGSGESFRDCWRDGGREVCGPEMTAVPEGSFQMGSSAAEIEILTKQYGDYFKPEGPQHEVKIPRPFAVGKFEVTFDEWDACVKGGGCQSNKAPSDLGWGTGKRPVIDVSWNDAQEYVGWLNSKVADAP